MISIDFNKLEELWRDLRGRQGEINELLSGLRGIKNRMNFLTPNYMRSLAGARSMEDELDYAIRKSNTALEDIEDTLNFIQRMIREYEDKESTLRNQAESLNLTSSFMGPVSTAVDGFEGGFMSVEGSLADTASGVAEELETLEGNAVKAGEETLEALEDKLEGEDEEEAPEIKEEKERDEASEDDTENKPEENESLINEITAFVEDKAVAAKDFAEEKIVGAAGAIEGFGQAVENKVLKELKPIEEEITGEFKKIENNKNVENMALNGEALLEDYKEYFTATDVNRLKEVPGDIEKREELLENSGKALWNSFEEDHPDIKTSINVAENGIKEGEKLAKEGWDKFKEIDPVRAGIYAGGAKFGFDTIKGLALLAPEVVKFGAEQSYDYRVDPKGTEQNWIRYIMDINGMEGYMPQTADDKKIEAALVKNFKNYLNGITHGDIYTRTEKLTYGGLTVGSFFLPGADAADVAKVGEVGSDVAKAEEAGSDIRKATEVGSEARDTADVGKVAEDAEDSGSIASEIGTYSVGEAKIEENIGKSFAGEIEVKLDKFENEVAKDNSKIEKIISEKVRSAETSLKEDILDGKNTVSTAEVKPKDIDIQNRKVVNGEREDRNLDNIDGRDDSINRRVYDESNGNKGEIESKKNDLLEIKEKEKCIDKFNKIRENWVDDKKASEFISTLDEYAEEAVNLGACESKTEFYKMYADQEYNYSKEFIDSVKKIYSESGASSIINKRDIENAFSRFETIGRAEHGNFTTSITEDKKLLYDNEGNLFSGAIIEKIKGVDPGKYTKGIYQYNYDAELIDSFEKLDIIRTADGRTPGASSLNIPGCHTWAGENIKYSESELIMPSIDVSEFDSTDVFESIRDKGYFAIKNPTIICPDGSKTQVNGTFKIENIGE